MDGYHICRVTAKRKYLVVFCAVLAVVLVCVCMAAVYCAECGREYSWLQSDLCGDKGAALPDWPITHSTRSKDPPRNDRSQ